MPNVPVQRRRAHLRACGAITAAQLFTDRNHTTQASGVRRQRPLRVDSTRTSDDPIVSFGDVDGEHEKVLLWVQGSSGDVRDPIQPSRRLEWSGVEYRPGG
jgi:hypothetical protein